MNKGEAIVALIVLLFGAVILAFLTSPIWAGVFGVGTPVQSGQYQGQIVNVEHNKGLVFRTTQIHVKSGDHADSPQEFCIHERNQPEQLEKARKAAAEDRNVTVHYTRNIVHPGWECRYPAPVITHVTVDA